MKYKYLYQTKDNENREGWIKAKDRADAYAKLRKQGVFIPRNNPKALGQSLGNNSSMLRCKCPEVGE